MNRPTRDANERTRADASTASRSSDSRVSFVDEGAPRRVDVTALNLTTDEIAPGEPFTDTEIFGRLHMDGFARRRRAVPARRAEGRAAPRTIRRSTSRNSSCSSAASRPRAACRARSASTLKLAGRDRDQRLRSARAADLGRESRRRRPPIPRRWAGRDSPATWRFDAGAMRVDPFALTLDDTHFTGNFRRGAGEDPVGEFALRGDALDIARYIPPADPAERAVRVAHRRAEGAASSAALSSSSRRRSMTSS